MFKMYITCCNEGMNPFFGAGAIALAQALISGFEALDSPQMIGPSSPPTFSAIF